VSPDEMNEGDYVSVVGTIRDFKGKKTVQGTRVVKLDNPDLVTYHYLDCVRAHLELTRVCIHRQLILV
jgi:hypothetical protein